MRKLLPLVLFSSLFFLGGAPKAGQRGQEERSIVLVASFMKHNPDGTMSGGWKPSRIRVAQGTKLKLTITAIDSRHAFSIPDLGIESPDIEEGATGEFTFVPKTAGTFEFRCKYHQRMTGELEVAKR